MPRKLNFKKAITQYPMTNNISAVFLSHVFILSEHPYEKFFFGKRGNIINIITLQLLVKLITTNNSLNMTKRIMYRPITKQNI